MKFVRRDKDGGCYSCGSRARIGHAVRVRRGGYGHRAGAGWTLFVVRGGGE